MKRHQSYLGRTGRLSSVYTIISCLVLLMANAGPALAETMDFAVIGDMPYNAQQETEYKNLIKDINSQNLAYVVHAGDYWFDGLGWKPDTKGLPPCADATYDDRMKSTQTFKHPFILTPGDNDWTDCHRAKPVAYDPLERLDKFRKMFFKGDSSLGQRTMKLVRQSSDKKYAEYVENARWAYGGATFITLHITGSNNNFGRTLEMDKEFEARDAANTAWMNAAFDEAKRNGSKAIMILAQANPNFENTWSGKLQERYLLKNLGFKPPKEKRKTGFDYFLKVLEERTLEFGKPVVYVHGDTHTFRIDKPLVRTPDGKRFIENFTRVETFGFPNTHWVRVTIDPNDPNYFRFRAEIVEENKVKAKH